MRSSNISRLQILVAVLLSSAPIFSFEKEDYRFSFKVVNQTSKGTFIKLVLPGDIVNVPVKYADIKNPILHIGYVADSKSQIEDLKRDITVKYENNWTKVYFINPSNAGAYNCVTERGEYFRSGACFNGAVLILPPDLEVSIFLNDKILYSKAELKEIKAQYSGNVPKDDAATAKAKKQSTEAKLKELNSMLRKGLITKEEYAEKKKALLDGM